MTIRNSIIRSDYQLSENGVDVRLGIWFVSDQVTQVSQSQVTRVPQDYIILGSLIFLTFINDLHLRSGSITLSSQCNVVAVSWNLFVSNQVTDVFPKASY